MYPSEILNLTLTGWRKIEIASNLTRWRKIEIASNSTCSQKIEIESNLSWWRKIEIASNLTRWQKIEISKQTASHIKMPKFSYLTTLYCISEVSRVVLATFMDILTKLGFFAFLILKVAFKVNYDFELEICGLCWYFCYLKLVGRRLRNHPDFVTNMGFWPFWPWKWPSRSLMTLNLKSLAFIPYVSLFSGICIAVWATLDHFQRLIFRKKEPHVDLLPQVKTKK